MREPETIQAAVEKCAKEFGKLDILVNNAAGNFMCSAEDLSPNGFATVLAIDLQVCNPTTNNQLLFHYPIIPGNFQYL